MVHRLWNFCDVDGDGEASRNEMITCTVKAVNYFEMPESMQDLVYELLIQDFCDVVDRDISGGLSYDELRYVFGSFAFYTAIFMESHDTDNNGLFDEAEAEAWDDYLTDLLYDLPYEYTSYGDFTELSDQQPCSAGC